MLSKDLPWANWFWNKCPARTGDGVSCDLEKGHEDFPHVATRGVYDVVWEESVGYPSPPWTEKYISEISENISYRPNQSDQDDSDN